ncbi:MAG: hypothetical protein EOO71_11075 [Myxococcaceae bacterium]|nr:MAG: hypothetical protein EOO71_11075 [Myxococcaceae bacterium]
MRTRHLNLPHVAVLDYSYSKDTPFASTRLSRFLDFSGIKTMREHHQHIAEGMSGSFGCANCRGIEALRSCLRAYSALKDYDQVANPRNLGMGALTSLQSFLRDHGPRLEALRGILVDLNVPYDGKFGEVYDFKAYKHGLRDGRTPLNPIGERWYGVMKTLFVARNGPGPLNAILDTGVGQSVTKPSAHAHAVIARASLEIGIRFGFCEFMTFASFSDSTKQVRTLRSVAAQAVTIVDPDAQLGQTLMGAIEQIRRRYEAPLRERRMPAPSDEALAGELCDQAIAGIAAIVASQESHQRANCFALCSVYRALFLAFSNITLHAQRTRWRDLRQKVTGVGDLLTYYPKSRAGNSLASINLKGFSDSLGKGGFGDVARLIHLHGKSWKTVREVEFAKQCGECESEQGAFDLPGRVVDSRVLHKGPKLDPSIGLSFSELGVAATDDQTPWDLTAAVGAQAVWLILADLQKLAPREPVIAEMVGVCDAAAPLFVGYMEMLFLGLGFAGCTSLPLVLEEAHVRTRQETAVIPWSSSSVSVPAYTGPTSVELNEAARKLGMTLKELMERETVIDVISRQYRQQARHVAPRAIGDEEEAFKALGSARDLLVSYFRDAAKTASQPLRLEYH